MLSRVAGILDSKGGLRVVVTQRHRMHQHVGADERLFVVPKLKVQEPVPWDDIPTLIAKVQQHVAKQLAPTNKCGECRACCTTCFIKAGDFRKPSYTPCKHECAQGCRIYWQRPTPCRQFKCMWLKSQSRNDVMPPELRPDRCGAFFVELDGSDIFEVHLTKRGIEQPIARRFVDAMQSKGYRARLIARYAEED